MPETMPNTQPQQQSAQPTQSQDNDTKKWKGLKEKDGNYIVYITESSERVFNSIDEAVKYMTSAAIKETLIRTANFSRVKLRKMSREELIVEFKKIAGSPEFPGVQRGQENIDGVKQITKTYKLVEGPDGEFKVKETIRTDIAKDTSSEASNALKNIEQEKEEATYVENPFKEEVKKESFVKSGAEVFEAQPSHYFVYVSCESEEEKKQVLEALSAYDKVTVDEDGYVVVTVFTDEGEQGAIDSVKNWLAGRNINLTSSVSAKESSVLAYSSIGNCAKCNAYIYPPDMGNWFNRQIPAETFCPSCGYGDLSQPGAFIYSNPDVQQVALEDYIIQPKKM